MQVLMMSAFLSKFEFIVEPTRGKACRHASADNPRIRGTDTSSRLIAGHGLWPPSDRTFYAHAKLV